MPPTLPEGYSLERDDHTQKLIAPNQKVIATFTRGVSEEAIGKVARGHSELVDEDIQHLEGLLKRRRGELAECDEPTCWVCEERGRR